MLRYDELGGKRFFGCVYMLCASPEAGCMLRLKRGRLRQHVGQRQRFADLSITNLASLPAHFLRFGKADFADAVGAAA